MRLLEHMKLNGTIDPMPPCRKVGRPLWGRAQERLQAELNQIRNDIRHSHNFFEQYRRDAFMRGTDPNLGQLEFADERLSSMLKNINRLLGDSDLPASLVLEVQPAHREWVSSLQEPCKHAYECVNEVLFCETAKKAVSYDDVEITRIRESMREMSADECREEMRRMRESPPSAASLLMPTLPRRHVVRFGYGIDRRFDVDSNHREYTKEDFDYAANLMRNLTNVTAM